MVDFWEDDPAPYFTGPVFSAIWWRQVSAYTLGRRDA